MRQDRARKSLTKGACNATSEGSDNPISAYRPIYVNGRQTIQFANKKNLSIWPAVASTDLRRTENHVETNFVAGFYGC